MARRGLAHGLARFRCRDCRRTFNALTGTSLARLCHKARWLTFGAALRDAASVRRSAGKCGVAVSNAFRWRHRFLQAPAASRPAGPSGIVETDETFFRRSAEGSRRWTRPSPDAVAPTRPVRRRGVRTGKRGTSLDEPVPVPVPIVRDRNRTTSDALSRDQTPR